MAKEAIEVEEKEEKLVSETVKHLNEANVQIDYLSEEFSNKSDESIRQKEEIQQLMAKVRVFSNILLQLLLVYGYNWEIQS